MTISTITNKITGIFSLYDSEKEFQFQIHVPCFYTFNQLIHVLICALLEEKQKIYCALKLT